MCIRDSIGGAKERGVGELLSCAREKTEEKEGRTHTVFVPLTLMSCSTMWGKKLWE